MRKCKTNYHHGDLAESLLDSVNDIASEFGLEAVTLRGCAKRLGVSPSSAFRHYADKRALMTAFATRAIQQLSAAMSVAAEQTAKKNDDGFLAVALAYIMFAIDKPALFRAMWRQESIYSSDEAYLAAELELASHLQRGFAETLEDLDPNQLNSEELLAWSAVHGLASLLVDGSLAKANSRESKLLTARHMIETLKPALAAKSTASQETP